MRQLEEQTDDTAEREGIDVNDVNRLARSYRRRFNAEMPHPKMDALVNVLANSWQTSEKTLVFVRRVASVKELKRILDEPPSDPRIVGTVRAIERRLVVDGLVLRFDTGKMEDGLPLSEG